MEYTDVLTRDRRVPGVIPHRSYSIYNFCRECRGWEGEGRSLSAEVDACPNDDCPLWAYRTQKASLKRYSDKFGSKGTSTTSFPEASPGLAKTGANMASNVHPGEYTEAPIRTEAIKNMCRSCRCVSPGEKNIISGCDDVGCHLYPWRTGKLEID